MIALTKIGIINVDHSPSGLHQFLQRILSQLSSYEVVGIEWNDHEGKMHTKDLHEYASSYPVLQTVSSDVLERLIGDLHLFSRIIVIGGINVFKELKKVNNQIEFLFVPASIHNNITWTELSLGYDTALNSIIESTLKIKDTIESLKYSIPRLFGVQIPGEAPSKMLKDLSIAVDGFYLESQSNQNQFNRDNSCSIQQSLKNNFSNGLTYSFLLFDERIYAANIPEYSLPELDVDWKVIQIDEALCMGQNPSALDRIIAKTFANQAVEWVHSHAKSEVLYIDRREVKRKSYSRV